MFSISKGTLNLNHPACKSQIDFFAGQNFNKVNIDNFCSGHYDHRIAKHFYFSVHPADLPITVLVYGEQILNIHPGTSRVLAYYLSDKKKIPAIFLQVGSMKELEFAENVQPITEKNELTLVNQNDKPNKHFWQINVIDQEYYKKIENEKQLSKKFKEFFYSCLDQNSVDTLKKEYLKNNQKKFWKLCSQIARENFNKKLAIKPQRTGAWQYNSDFHWNVFFKNYDVFLVEMLPNAMSEFIAHPNEIESQSRWIKKYKDTERKFPEIFINYELDEFVKDYTEIYDCLKSENHKIVDLVDNKLWMNCKGYEYIKTIQSVYKHGGINYSSSILTNICGERNFKYHPGRHLSFAKRFIGQPDIHFLTIKKQDREWLDQYDKVKIITQIETKNQILENMPKEMTDVSTWLQGTFPVYTWPFVNGEIKLPTTEWGDLKDDCGYTVITKSGKEENMKVFTEYAKILKNTDLQNLYKGKKKNHKKLNERYLGFLLNNQEGDEFEKG